VSRVADLATKRHCAHHRRGRSGDRLIAIERSS
jgi:hypothetical protein